MPIYIEVPDVDWTLKNQAFIDITYEHVNYFSRLALLGLFDPSTIPEGGSLFDDQYQFVIGRLGALAQSFVESYRSGEWERLEFDRLFPGVGSSIGKIEATLKDQRSAYVWARRRRAACSWRIALDLVKSWIRLTVSIKPAKVESIFSPSRSFADTTISCRGVGRRLLVVANPAYEGEFAAPLPELDWRRWRSWRFDNLADGVLRTPLRTLTVAI